ncbi:aminoglycoside phosphotransferase family protein [Micromonospora polyrhachis]|uniref:Aminoglycoside phosphotransferase (APT) family kinase protein n=2 Tax=Micromonospora polyrhachis TaxID=1282883 RepID=A0A7W7SVL5_9ACTN|nr:aminoglycoside phosphotransferase (APT) family kinase protein [Micromonospora polyrhachis]
MTDAMHQVARQLGVPVNDARLIRLTNNAVFALPSAGLVIRITRSHQLHDRVHKVVRLAQWFAQIDAPTIRLAPDIAQPVQVGNLLASVWRYVPSAPQEPTVENLGTVLREFHALGAPPFPLAAWDPVRDARLRISDAEALSDSHRALLLGWCNRLAPQVAALNRRSGEQQLIHGDAHVGNLLCQPIGHVVLCDFDATCIGPWQADLAAVAVGEARFGRTAAHSVLAAAYGYDVTTDPDWPLLRDARELKMIAAAVPLLASSAGIAAEFDTRLRSIVEDDQHARWTPYAQLSH